MATATKGKRYYWLKLSEDFFKQKEIKKLRSIAGGDTFTIIYLKMLLRSMKDDGKLYYEGVEDSFVSELALDIDENEENVGVTVRFLIAKGILHQNTASEYEVITANEMTGSECESARRVRKMRAAKAIETADCAKRALQCNTMVTSCNTEKEKEIEIEIEKEKKNTSYSCTEPSRKVSVPSNPPVISLPLNDGSEHPVTQEDVEKYKSLYPAVDVMQELRNMYGWLDSNKNRRKTKSGIRRFINSWLSKEQNNSGSQYRGNSNANGGYVFRPRFDTKRNSDISSIAKGDEII